MAFKMTTSLEQIFSDFMKAVERRETVVINTFRRAGNIAVNDARLNGDYMDQSGNLRGSIGYQVIKNGVVLYTGGFKQVKEGSKGVSDGKKFIEEIAEKFPTGIVLVVVAGMEYAAYVEAMGRNVITSAELIAEEIIRTLINKLRR